jgi:2-polyprenyl-3-methyl-5-hydroxy-6-metoxy-1,4-benzoquinol methylase
LANTLEASMDRRHKPVSDEKMLAESQRFWDREAAVFDDEPDHGLRAPEVLSAWTTCLARWMPASATTVLDVGCGTGPLSLVLASLGYEVTGIDLSPEMISRAEAKARSSGLLAVFSVMDASRPHLAPQQYDVVVCRHVLWALPDIAHVLERWTGLLTPGGRILLIEGFWKTNVSLHAEQIVEALPSSLADMTVENLSSNDRLWGRRVTDERYAVIATLAAHYYVSPVG